jgi:uncharacterized protein
LKIDVRGLLESPGRQRQLDLMVPLTGEGGPDAGWQAASARVLLALTGTSGGVLARGNVVATPELVCGRCLEQFRQEVGGGFEQLYRSASPTETTSQSRRGRGSEDLVAGDAAADAASADEEDEVEVLPIVEGQIDIRSLVLEALALSLPMKPLCAPDCRGLCPRCGRNLNQGPCGCATEEADPRLEALGRLVSPGEDNASGRQVPQKERDQRGRTKT